MCVPWHRSARRSSRRSVPKPPDTAVLGGTEGTRFFLHWLGVDLRRRGTLAARVADRFAESPRNRLLQHPSPADPVEATLYCGIAMADRHKVAGRRRSSPKDSGSGRDGLRSPPAVSMPTASPSKEVARCLHPPDKVSGSIRDRQQQPACR